MACLRLPPASAQQYAKAELELYVHGALQAARAANPERDHVSMALESLLAPERCPQCNASFNVCNVDFTLCTQTLTCLCSIWRDVQQCSAQLARQFSACGVAQCLRLQEESQPVTPATITFGPVANAPSLLTYAHHPSCFLPMTKTKTLSPAI